MTPVKAIRLKCMDCMCQQVAEVRNCSSIDCPLYMFRMGHNPNRASKKKIKGITPMIEKEDSLYDK